MAKRSCQSRFAPQCFLLRDSRKLPFRVAQELEPLTVTATRLPTPEDRSPSAISVISDSDIDLHQYRFVSDALQSVPGVNVVQTGTPGQVTSVFIRGNRSDQTQVLLDGIQFNQGLSGAFNFADFTNDNISRIEVIRGPQSALYGSQASGGVINLITAVAKADQLDLFISKVGHTIRFEKRVARAANLARSIFPSGLADTTRKTHDRTTAIVAGVTG